VDHLGHNQQAAHLRAQTNTAAQAQGLRHHTHVGPTHHKLGEARCCPPAAGREQSGCEGPVHVPVCKAAFCLSGVKAVNACCSSSTGSGLGSSMLNQGMAGSGSKFAQPEKYAAPRATGR
jgi:hypothetical protein